MTQSVTLGDMFVNFGKCLQTFSKSGKISNVEFYKASQHTHLASLPGGCDNRNAYDLSKEPNLKNAFINCVFTRFISESLSVVTVYFVTLVPFP